jgi:ABC-type Fe3+ transport system permease subunit
MKLEICFKLVLFFMFGTGYAVAAQYSQKARQFPRLIALITLILIALSLIQDLYRWLRERESASTKSSETSPKDNIRRTRFFKAWLIIIVSTGAGVLGGFLFSAFLLLAGFPLLLGDETGRSMVWQISLAAMMTACIYMIFEYLMGVPLLTGLLLDL